MRAVCFYSMLLFSFSASANLITLMPDKTSYSAGESINLEIYLNNSNPSMSWLEFDVNFNDFDIAFSHFEETNDVLLNSSYSDAFDMFGFAPVTVLVEFNSDWTSNLTPSFKLGTATFTSINANNGNFSLGYLDVQDDNYMSIAHQSVVVSEPTVWLLFLVCGVWTIVQRSAVKSLHR